MTVDLRLCWHREAHGLRTPLLALLSQFSPRVQLRNEVRVARGAPECPESPPRQHSCGPVDTSCVLSQYEPFLPSPRSPSGGQLGGEQQGAAACTRGRSVERRAEEDDYPGIPYYEQHRWGFCCSWQLACCA